MAGYDDEIASQFFDEIARSAVDLDQPTQERLRRDISDAFYRQGRDALDMPVSYTPSMRARFPHGEVPTTVREAQDLLVRSHYPMWIDQARREYWQGENAMDVFQSLSTNYMAGLQGATHRQVEGKKVAAEPSFGHYSAYYGYKAEKRAMDTPSGTIGTDAMASMEEGIKIPAQFDDTPYHKGAVESVVDSYTGEVIRSDEPGFFGDTSVPYLPKGLRPSQDLSERLEDIYTPQDQLIGPAQYYGVSGTGKKRRVTVIDDPLAAARQANAGRDPYIGGSDLALTGQPAIEDQIYYERPQEELRAKQQDFANYRYRRYLGVELGAPMGRGFRWGEPRELLYGDRPEHAAYDIGDVEFMPTRYTVSHTGDLPDYRPFTPLGRILTQSLHEVSGSPQAALQRYMVGKFNREGSIPRDAYKKWEFGALKSGKKDLVKMVRQAKRSYAQGWSAVEEYEQSATYLSHYDTILNEGKEFPDTFELPQEAARSRRITRAGDIYNPVSSQTPAMNTSAFGPYAPRPRYSFSEIERAPDEQDFVYDFPPGGARSVRGEALGNQPLPRKEYSSPLISDLDDPVVPVNIPFVEKQRTVREGKAGAYYIDYGFSSPSAGADLMRREAENITLDEYNARQQQTLPRKEYSSPRVSDLDDTVISVNIPFVEKQRTRRGYSGVYIDYGFSDPSAGADLMRRQHGIETLDEYNARQQQPPGGQQQSSGGGQLLLPERVPGDDWIPGEEVSWVPSHLGQPPIGPPGPPEEPPPGFFDEPPQGPGSEFQVHPGSAGPLRPEVVEAGRLLAEGKSVGAFLPPGWGKTAFIRQAQVARGQSINILTTPQTSLNKSLMQRLSSNNVQAFWLPGDPGANAPEEAVREYREAHSAFYKAINESTEVVDGVRRFKPGAKSITAVMSTEKFVGLEHSNLGQRLMGYFDQGLGGTTTFDEFQELLSTSAGRYLFKYAADTAEKLGLPVMATGGTLPEDIRPNAISAFGLDKVYTEPIDLSHIQFKVRNAQMKDYPTVGAELSTTGETQSFTYGYSTRLVDQIYEAIGGAENPQAARYHKGHGLAGPIPQEELLETEELFTSETGGLPEGQTVVGSSAMGLGIDINNLKQVSQIGAADTSALLQRAMRLRAYHGGGEFNLAVDPRQYFQWAEAYPRDMQALTPTVLAGAYQKIKERAGTYDPNWKVMSDEMQEVAGEYLEGLGITKYRSKEALDILSEADFLKFTTSPEGYSTYQFAAGGPTDVLARKLEQSTYRLPTDPHGERVGLTEYKQTVAGLQQRELSSLGSLMQQTQGLPEEDRGAIVKQALMESQKGLSALESFVNIDVARSVHDKYIEAVKKATEQFADMTASGADVTRAQEQFGEAIQGAYDIIVNSPGAQAMAQTTGQAYLASQSPLNQAIGQTVLSQVQTAAAAGVPGTPGGGGDDGSGRPGRGFMKSPGAAALYGLYMARRMWQYTTAPIMQAGAEWAGQNFAPPTMIGQMPEGDYGSLMGGFAYRQAMAQAAAGQATYEQFGAFMELPYALSRTGGGGGRFAAATRMGMGIAAGGIEGGMGLSMASMAMGGAAKGGLAATLGTLGGALATGGMLIGGATMVGGFGLELYNASQGTNLTLGDLFKGGLFNTIQGDTLMAQLNNRRVGLYNPLDLYSVAGRERLFERFGGSEQQLFEGLPENMQNYYRIQGLAGQEKQVRDLAMSMAGDLGVDNFEGLVPYITALTRDTGQFNPEAIRGFMGTSVSLGYSPAEYTGMFGQIAGQLGYVPGSQQYRDLLEQMTGIGQVGLYNLQERASRNAQFASQLAPTIGGRRASALNLQSQGETTAIASLLQLYTQYGGDPNRIMGVEGTSGLAGAYRMIYPEEEFQNLQQQYGTQRIQALSPFLQGAMQYGVSPNYLGQMVGGLGEMFSGMSPYQMSLAGQIAGGDLRAASYASYNQPQILQTLGMDVAGSRLYGPAGRPIYQTSGADFMRMMMARSDAGMGAATAGLSAIGNMGVSDVGMMSAWLNEGTMGAQMYARGRLNELQQAQLGIQFSQLNLQRTHLWGGGAWTGTPAAGSLWGLEDQQRALGHRYQMMGFDLQERRMDATHSYQDTMADIQWRRMQQGQDYQMDMMQIGRQMTLQSRSYQDQVRGLQWGWQLEDYADESRFLTGRQRRVSERQMRRQTTLHELEEENIQKMRSLEDQRYERQKEYTEENMDLEREAFEAQKKYREEMQAIERETFDNNKQQYLEQREIQEKIIDLQRQYQADQLDLQEASLANQQEMLDIQQDLEKIMQTSQKAWEDIAGELEQINSYSNVVEIFEKFKELLKEIGAEPEEKEGPSIPQSPYRPDEPSDDDEDGYDFDTVTLFERPLDERLNVIVKIGNEVFKDFVIETVEGELA